MDATELRQQKKKYKTRKTSMKMARNVILRMVKEKWHS